MKLRNGKEYGPFKKVVSRSLVRSLTNEFAKLSLEEKQSGEERIEFKTSTPNNDNEICEMFSMAKKVSRKQKQKNFTCETVEPQ